LRQHDGTALISAHVSQPKSEQNHLAWGDRLISRHFSEQ
jgi:hypothetical protein